MAFLCGNGGEARILCMLVNTSPFISLQRVNFVMIWSLIARGGSQMHTPEGNLILKAPDIHLVS